jgi:transcriptional regulator
MVSKYGQTLPKKLGERAKRKGLSRREYLLGLLNKHGSVAEVARKLQTSRQNMRYIYKLESINTYTLRLSEYTKRQIDLHLASGADVVQIGLLTGLTQRSIMRYIEEKNACG